MARSFPYPTGAGQASEHNLPAQLTPLIGRAHEVAAACTLLRQSEVRLLTLTGTGGVGKTRLGLQIATELREDFADGICLVSLAPISDPDLVLPTIAQTFVLFHKRQGRRIRTQMVEIEQVHQIPNGRTIGWHVGIVLVRFRVG